MLPWVLCAVLAALVLILLFRIHLLHRCADALGEQLAEKREQETNTLLTLPSGDRHMAALARRLNEELKALRAARLGYAQGDQALKEAVTDLAHDLRTPLTAIRGYLELLGREELPENAVRYTAILQERAERMADLTDDLFQYTLLRTPQSPLHLETTILNRALEEQLAAFYSVLAQRGIEPAVTMPETPVLRQADPKALARILSNLLQNAARYSPGDLSVTLTRDGQVIFANTAPELDPVAVGRLFHRYETLAAARPATGLGLTIAHALAERMGGSLTAEYREGKLILTLFFPEALPNG